MVDPIDLLASAIPEDRGVVYASQFSSNITKSVDNRPPSGKTLLERDLEYIFVEEDGKFRKTGGASDEDRRRREVKINEGEIQFQNWESRMQSLVKVRFLREIENRQIYTSLFLEL